MDSPVCVLCAVSSISNWQSIADRGEECNTKETGNWSFYTSGGRHLFARDARARSSLAPTIHGLRQPLRRMVGARLALALVNAHSMQKLDLQEWRIEKIRELSYNGFSRRYISNFVAR